MVNETKREEIHISKEIIQRIRSVVNETEFESEEAYIEFVFNQVLPESTDERSLENVEQKEVQDRLKSLGYINE